MHGKRSSPAMKKGGVYEVPVTHKDLLAHMVCILRPNSSVPLVFPSFLRCRARSSFCDSIKCQAVFKKSHE